MDIQVASNFERYLFYLYDRDAAAICTAMETFKQTGKLEFTAEQLETVQQTFAACYISAWVDEDGLQCGV